MFPWWTETAGRVKGSRSPAPGPLRWLGRGVTSLWGIVRENARNTGRPESRGCGPTARVFTAGDSWTFTGGRALEGMFPPAGAGRQMLRGWQFPGEEHKLTDSNTGRRWPCPDHGRWVWKGQAEMVDTMWRGHRCRDWTACVWPVCSVVVQRLCWALTQVLAGPWEASLSSGWSGDWPEWGTNQDFWRTWRKQIWDSGRLAASPTCSPVGTGRGFQLAAGHSSPVGVESSWEGAGLRLQVHGGCLWETRI